MTATEVEFIDCQIAAYEESLEKLRRRRAEVIQARKTTWEWCEVQDLQMGDVALSRRVRGLWRTVTSIDPVDGGLEVTFDGVARSQVWRPNVVLQVRTPRFCAACAEFDAAIGSRFGDPKPCPTHDLSA